MAQNIKFELLSPADIQAELGRRAERLRLAQNVNQSALAREAGVSRRTITRLENGESVSLDTFIRILAALGMLERLEALLPEPAVSPIERVRQRGRERQRASKGSSRSAAWRWDDEAAEP